MIRMPNLVLFAGLPGTGKSTLAYQLAKETGWCLISKDQISQALKKEGIENGRAGYEVLLGLAEFNLKNSVSVILDASFGFENLRMAIIELTKRYQARFFGVEYICTDEEALKKRFEGRLEMVAGWQPADWTEYLRVKKYWEPWPGDHLKLDALSPASENYQTLLKFLNQ